MYIKIQKIIIKFVQNKIMLVKIKKVLTQGLYEKQEAGNRTRHFFP